MKIFLSVMMTLLVVGLWPCQSSFAQWYVSANGSPLGDGSPKNPWDLATALCSALVEPGQTVWIAGGTYHGPFAKSASPSGTKDAPIIYRAMPGQRVTLTADKTEPVVLWNYGSYIWFWGFEVTIDGDSELGLWGNAVKQETGTGARYINMVVHDCPNRSGFFVSGTGAEFYGCLSYRNGRWAGGYAHGLYCQNRPENVGSSTDELPWMNFFNCIMFDNFGWGIHSYAEGTGLANMVYDGLIVYGNGMGNFLSGSLQYDDNFIIRNCWTYHPDGERLNAEFGYSSPLNGRLTIENNVFVGGSSAVWLNNWQQIMFQNNTCYNNDGWLVAMNTPETAFQYIFDNNKYHWVSRHLAYLDGTCYHTLDALQTQFSYDHNSVNTVEAPIDSWVFLRPNKYESDRAHLVVYNWPKTEMVTIDLAKLWEAKKDKTYRYRIVSIEDIWGEAVAEGEFDDTSVELKMTGPYAPEFACYLVTRSSASHTAWISY